MSPERKRPEKKSPTPPERDVTDRQDPEHSEADFMRDLARVSTNRSKQKLAERARRD
jgi:hypothetical protein